MNPLQETMARQFAERINRDVTPIERDDHNGFDLAKPDGTRIGFVRYTESGREFNVPYYTFYAYNNFDDPNSHFRAASASGQARNSVCFALPDHEYKISYAVRVLESAYDLN